VRVGARDCLLRQSGLGETPCSSKLALGAVEVAIVANNFLLLPHRHVVGHIFVRPPSRTPPFRLARLHEPKSLGEIEINRLLRSRLDVLDLLVVPLDPCLTSLPVLCPIATLLRAKNLIGSNRQKVPAAFLAFHIAPPIPFKRGSFSFKNTILPG
jgi:hypothetical protein